MFRGLDPFKRTDDEKLKAIELICSKPGGLDAILNKKYKLKPMFEDEIQAFKDQQRVKRYYALNPSELDKHLVEFGFSGRDDFDEKCQIVYSYPHLPLPLTDALPEDIDNVVDQAIDTAIENQSAVRAFSDFEDRILHSGQVPHSDIAKITSFHFDHQQEGSEGKTFAQRLRKRSIQLKDKAAETDESKTKSARATESW